MSEYWHRHKRVLAHKKKKHITPHLCPWHSRDPELGCEDCRHNHGTAVSKAAKGGRMIVVCGHGKDGIA